MKSHAARRSEAGFTLLELMVAIVVIVVAFFGLLLSLHYGSVLNETARQMQAAHGAGRQAMEAVRAYEFAFTYRCFNADTTDDPNGASTAEASLFPLNKVIPQADGNPPLTALGDNIGNNFVVDGLVPRPTDPDGVVGAIVFPEAVDAGITVLSEQGQEAFLGPARDMNGNGTTNDVNVSDDYILLPMTVLVQWQGMFGDDREVRLDTVLHAQLR
ncbi:MAG: prepilin-type N-terminal cleavage/methylation domain-containing protein [Planctomycetota bacterium]|jgi:prepilin-type N-terminal cleavage/methylation domain-containing protein